MLLALLLAAAAPGQLEIRAADLDLAWHARLPVELRNGAPAPRRVRLAAEEGLLQVVPAEGLELPPGGSLRIELDVFRGRADWGSRQRLRLVALEGPPEAPVPVGLAELQVRVARDPAWLPRLRWPLLALGLGLLAGALGWELARRGRA